MKLYLVFFILFTIAEVLFTGIWFLIEERIDSVIITGICLYLIAMLAAFIGYKVAIYQQKKQALLNSLPG